MDREIGLMAERAERAAWADMLAAAPPPLKAGLGLRTAQIGDALAILSTEVDAAEFNRCFGLGLECPPSEADLDEILALYRPHGRRSARLQISPLAQPNDRLAAWIAARGLERSPLDWAKLGRRAEALSRPETGLEIMEASPAEAGDFARVVCSGFGMPPALHPWLAALVGRPGWRCYLAYDGEIAVGAGALHLGDGWGWLGLGATSPGARRKGAHGALMARRISDAAAAGKSWVFTETGDPTADNPDHPSYRNMLRSGFEPLNLRANYVI